MSQHMTPEEFRRNGYAVVDWVANYLETVESYPVMAQVEPGEISAMLPSSAPEAGEDFSALLEDLDRVVLPGVTHWQSPNWFAYFPANASPPSMLAELASAGLAQQGMLWSTSPAATEIESKVLDWLVELMGLPDGWKSDGPGGGVIHMSASDATHTALVVARHARRNEAEAASMVVYVSNQAHSSIEKGASVANIGHCRLVPVDREFAMDVDAFRSMVQQDIDAGLLPIAVVTAIGTTATTAVDDTKAVGELTREFGLWHHVDAAYAGTAMICEEFRVHQPALHLADSYTFNPHKWMMVNFDCNVMWVADRTQLIDAMSILPPYLRNEATASGDVIDYRDWHVPLGRRFRALKLWWVIRSYGAAGLRSAIRAHVELAEWLAQQVLADDRFDLFAPHPFGLVCFTHRDGNDATRRLATALNESGKVAVTPSTIDGTDFMRVSIGQSYTERRHAEALWALIDNLG
ncbi:MAG: pyridoxal-dependent decarboxylase [Acidimicrobiia bacterium]